MIKKEHVSNKMEKQIETLINNKTEMKISTSFMNSGASQTLLQNKLEIFSNSNSNNELNHNSSNVKNNNCNKNDSYNNNCQYFEREITTEEENKIKDALSNHFIFQDMNEDIM
jgi:hypothetical protein